MSVESGSHQEVLDILTDSVIGGQLKEVPEVAIELGIAALDETERVVNKIAASTGLEDQFAQMK